jgi:hypothetical protein
LIQIALSTSRPSSGSPGLDSKCTSSPYRAGRRRPATVSTSTALGAVTPGAIEWPHASPPPRFGNDLARHEKTQFDPDTGESDAFAAPFRACRNVVVACQLSALHASAIVDDRQCRIACVGQEANAGRTGVKRIRDHLSEDRFFEGPGVGIPQVFEEVLEVDTCFTHVRILSCGRIRVI